MDLFDQTAYPDRPGFKSAGTSKEAAKIAMSASKTIRERVLEELRHQPLTPDEAAVRLSLSVLAVRPRFSELAKKGLIIRTGDQRQNASGLKADVWRAA